MIIWRGFLVVSHNAGWPAPTEVAAVFRTRLPPACKSYYAKNPVRVRVGA